MRLRYADRAGYDERVVNVVTLTRIELLGGHADGADYLIPLDEPPPEWTVNAPPGGHPRLVTYRRDRLRPDGVWIYRYPRPDAPAGTR